MINSPDVGISWHFDPGTPIYRTNADLDLDLFPVFKENACKRIKLQDGQEESLP